MHREVALASWAEAACGVGDTEAALVLHERLAPFGRLLVTTAVKRLGATASPCSACSYRRRWSRGRR
jgi:hypothetical protein